jgi:hypothetical protein
MSPEPVSTPESAAFGERALGLLRSLTADAGASFGSARVLLALSRLHQILFRKDPVLEGERMIGEFVAVEFEGVLSDHPLGDAGGERFGLFRGLIAFFAHDCVSWIRGLNA